MEFVPIMRADGLREIGVLDKVMGGPLGVIVVPATETPFDNYLTFLAVDGGGRICVRRVWRVWGKRGQCKCCAT